MISATLYSIAMAQRQSRLPLLEQHMLWQQVLQVERAWLVAHDRDPLPAQVWHQYQALEQRRLQGEPMAYILGWREFMGLKFKVTPQVLIPRPDTEVLVEHLLQQVLPRYQRPRVLDLGTGSGAIAVSLAAGCAKARVVATDVCAEALAVAQDNAHTLCGGKVEFFLGNWYDALIVQDAFDVIVSNPPYIAADDTHLHQGDLRAEPRQALTDEQDGLGALATIITGAPRHLRQGGALWVEHGWNQSRCVRELLVQAGFTEPQTICDLAGNQRASGGTIFT